MKKLKSIIGYLLSFINNNITLFCTLFLLLVIPNYPSYVFPLKFYSFNVLLPSILTSLLYMGVISFFLCIISEVLYTYSRKVWKVYFISTHIIIYTISFVELCCIQLFHTQFEPLLLQLINETNTEETKEFFVTYIFQLKFILILLFYISIGILEFVLYRLVKKYQKTRIIFSWILIIIFCGLFINASYFLVNILRNKFDNDLEKQYVEIVKTNSYLRIVRAVSGFNATKQESSLAAEAHKIVLIDSCSYKANNIILIIGESHNKHHSSLYGYDLNTNPQLAALDSNLLVFKDVITPINATTESFKYFLSFRSSDNTEVDWHTYPFFPALFKKSGYNVIFYSNQFVQNEYEGNWDFVCGHFLDNKEINEACFSYRNKNKYQYDGDMVDAYINERGKIEKDSLNLIIFHLIGQHSDYASRYPKVFDYFSADSIKRQDLSGEKRAQIAHYDNAVLYNDYVINKIIELYKDKDALIIYFADHSEEVYDFRDFIGRSHNLGTNDENVLHNQLDIPFYVYASQKYKEKHLQTFVALKNVINKPFIIDDLPHLLLDLSGINVGYFNSERSLINEKYNCNRERMVGKNADYNYDKICK